MADFEKSIQIILDHEGSYVNNSNDFGGETNFGISKKSYPNIDIKNLTIDQAKQIYNKDYWIPIQGDQIIDQDFATALLDFAVNAGVVTAIKQVQKCLNIISDGIFGPKTLFAINTNGYLTKLFAKTRSSYYINIVKQKPNQIEFLEGWINRTIDLV